MQFNYVYITTNLLNGKQYIGDRTCSCDIEKDKYLGSGSYYKQAEHKHGKKNFKKQILESFDTREEAFNAQERYINEHNTLVPNGYNISPKGGIGVNECHSEQTKQDISNALRGKPKSEKHKQNISDSKKGEKSPMYGKHISENTRIQIINSNISRIGEKNPMYGKHISEQSKRDISNALKGKSKSKEHKQNISESHKGKRYITNGIITKQLKINEPIPIGWKLGRKRTL